MDLRSVVLLVVLEVVFLLLSRARPVAARQQRSGTNSHWIRGFCRLSSTERQLTPALGVRFRNQVIQANQFIFSALGRLLRVSPAGAFSSFGTLTWASCVA
jgi:hypothetical protein